MSPTPRYADAVDTTTHGEYRINRAPGDERPLYRFTGRITADGSSGFRAEPGRYHVYAGWFCPWAQRVTIQLALNGLEDVVSVSYVDGARDGRGWAFRETHGPDPVNGFTLLREAYEATEPGFDGHISVPTLWDRQTGRIVSNDFAGIGIDLATEFGEWSNGADHYPSELRPRIEELDSWLGPAVNRGVGAAAGEGAAAEAARAELSAAFAELDKLLGQQRHLLGERLTEADVRLWVTLARFDVAANAGGAIGPALDAYPNLWAYARDLYQRPAFAGTTDFATFARPGAVLPDWNAAHGREALVGAGA
ncbi:glutathione S-transferase C-terminal domain-containing protein [Kitasatospora herbaricolor]|uniref:Glutathione S-transferase C-terminal domain-containing protein n=1 Tax=Kitasatospora herbaricolor TaxID=68217 RepID=A0ABZ1W170_9ACTN|nr:glutathione S-transferase C-terminal domain-containing protein [Kitasatospora herbaricolor]